MSVPIALCAENGSGLVAENGKPLLREYVALPPAVEAAQWLQLRALTTTPTLLGLFPLPFPGALVVQAIRGDGVNADAVILYDAETDLEVLNIAPRNFAVLEPTALDALEILADSEGDEARVRIWVPGGEGYTVLNGGGVELKATHTPQAIGGVGAQVNHPAGATHQEILNIATQCTVVRPGLARKVGYYASPGSASPDLLGVYVRFWRRLSGNSYGFIGSSQNLKPSLIINDWSNIPVLTPFGVREGDLTSLLTVTNGNAVDDITNFKYRATSLQNYITISGASPLSAAVNWGTPSVPQGNCIPITALINSVSFLVIGDSLMCDSVGGRSFDDGVYSTIMMSQFLQSLLGGRPVDNVALGGAKLTLDGGIPDTFHNTYKLLLPAVVFANGGINDINSVSEATPESMLAEVEGILDTCIEIGAKLIYSTVWPFANSTTWSVPKETKRLEFNELLKQLAADNPTVMRVVDFDLALDIFEEVDGYMQFKPGMDAGDNSVHGNAASTELAAQHLYNALAAFVADNKYVF